MCYLTPSSINKKQSEYFNEKPIKGIDLKKKAYQNRLRGHKISSNARKSLELKNDVSNYIDQSSFRTLSEETRKHFISLRKSLGFCTTRTLCRQYETNGALEYIASHTCKHKLCPVCNAERKRLLRKKYIRYFEQNELIDRKTGEIYNSSDFDYMHLTLTVPHNEKTGFRDNRFYAKELIKEFNWMRKKEWWKKSVFGGEFGVEVTKNTSGMHIHIHSLLLVHKFKGSRDYLHKHILMAWNQQTKDKKAKRKSFTSEELESIKKGNKAISTDELQKLSPEGSTIVGLESLYKYSKKKLSRKDRWNADKKMWKHYVNSENPKDLIGGVLECIKYHFEPSGFNKEEGIFDLDLLSEILQNIYKQPLYRKFGNFHGVKELNISESLEDDVTEAIMESKKAINPLSYKEDENYKYIVLRAKSIYYDISKGYKPSIPLGTTITTLPGNDLINALTNMVNMGVRDIIIKKKSFQTKHN